VFLNHTLYLLYIHRLFLMARRYSLRVHAFCCMPNHVHLILEPTRKGGLSDFMRDLQSGYARLLHLPRGRDGHAWKHHYGCKRLSAQHYRTAMWYVEHNPVKAGLVQRAEDWPYSSAKAHVTGQTVILKGRRKRQAILELYAKRWQQEFPNTDWRAWLRSPAEEDLRQRIREVEQVLGKDSPRASQRSTQPHTFQALPLSPAASARLLAQPQPAKVNQAPRAPDGS
jgi:REP element-mobilizing transposase RayT